MQLWIRSEEDMHTWAAPCTTPIFLIREEALQPQKSTPSISPKCQLKIFWPSGAQRRFSEGGGALKQLHDGHNKCVEDVAV